MTTRQPLFADEIEDYDVAIIVAGSRTFNNYQLFCEMLDRRLSEKDIVDKRMIFISGAAPAGADSMIIRWCRENNMPWVEFPADWDNIHVENAVLRTNRRGGLYNAIAGHQRNEIMAEHATHLILFYDGTSTGSKDMLARAKNYNLENTVYIVDKDVGR